ncbi:sulfite exporter TauE/SafE family protein [Paenibacillus frigoriresistens]|uniref:TSUP family transporter n=1 Tax=Paenibacillus alginolyticus TaxID=59839 RepID=UPI0015635EA0|nr:sulfite exporter TauE/SafE family protein [Paenibacillus frigoriresistens]
MKKSEKKWKLTITAGAILGFIVDLTYVGQGSLFAVAIMLFHRMSSSKLVGTDIAHAFLLVTESGLLHVGFGNVNYLFVLNLISGSVPEALIGSKLSAKISTKFLLNRHICHCGN